MKPLCSRPDCDKPMRQWGFCMNHSILWRRNGVPYRQDEIAEMRDSNVIEQAMTAALDADPPVIQWTGGLVKNGLILHDPHSEKRAS